MTNSQKFLDTYKSLEESIREQTGGSVLDYETSLNRSPEGEKLQVCRILRNYAAHHEDGTSFLLLPEQTAFLEQEILKFQSVHLPVEAVAVKCDPAWPSMTLKQVLTLFRRARDGFLPVTAGPKDRSLVGSLTPERLIRALGKTQKLSGRLSDSISRAEWSRSRRDLYQVHRGDKLDQFEPGTPLVLVDDRNRYQKVVSWHKLEQLHTRRKKESR